VLQGDTSLDQEPPETAPGILKRKEISYVRKETHTRYGTLFVYNRNAIPACK
jgi:hypothetical protein